MGLMFLFPIAEYVVGDNTYIFNLFGLDVAGNDVVGIPLYIIAGLIGLLSLISIFLFSNRKNQLKLSTANFFFVLVFVITVYVLISSVIPDIPKPADVEGYSSMGIGFFMPIVALAFTFLANRSIRKDEQLVASLDRLR